MTIEITSNERGFHIYGDSLRCDYNTEIRVYESSAAIQPHVWVSLLVDPAIFRDREPGEAYAHLNRDQAAALIARLQAWLDEIPERWGIPA